MPNKDSAKKALRQSLRRHGRNIAKKKKIKELRKETLKVLATTPANAAELMQQTMQALDKAAKTNTIHPNKAARLKSRLQRKINAATHQRTSA